MLRHLYRRAKALLRPNGLKRSHTWSRLTREIAEAKAKHRASRSLERELSQHVHDLLRAGKLPEGMR